MKAVVRRKYGPPNVLELAEVEMPVVEDDMVLVRVHATSINAGDWHIMRGRPYIVRVMGYGLLKPKKLFLGSDLAGRVEAVGKDVTEFQPGDEVFGLSIKTFAEYVAVRAVGVVPKPANVTFEQAATVPVAGLTALQGLRDEGQLQLGQEVLINGASGGVGTFAVQIAKALGANVTGVCRTRNLDMVRSLGAADVIDYTQEDFTRNGRRYDLIFDVAGNHSLSACKRALKPRGALVVVGQSGRGEHSVLPLLKVFVLSRFVRYRLRTFISKRDKEDLTILKGFLETGKLTPVIDGRYPLSEASEAMRYFGVEHPRGKVVLTI